MKIRQIKLVIQWFTMFIMHFFALVFQTWCAAFYNTGWSGRDEGKTQTEVMSGELDQFLDLCVTLPDSNSVVEDSINNNNNKFFLSQAR